LRRFSRAFASFFKQWIGLAKAVKHYWGIYGGFAAVAKSPYVHISLVLTIVCVQFWTGTDVKAYDIALGAVPNLLGFTVGALAIVLAFSSADFFTTLAEEGDPRSFFMSLTASLTHFVLVQGLALVVAASAKISGSKSLDYVSLFFFFYAVLVTFAAGMQLFHTAVIYNARASLRDPCKEEKPDDEE
jgi:hypothetical protein